jgi:hypothetical protein
MSRIAEIMREARVQYTVAKAQAESEARLPPVRTEPLLADPSVIALIRLPVGVSTLVTLGHSFEQMAKRKGGEAMMRQEGEWLVITAATPPRAHAPDCAIAVNGRHACSCAAIGGSDMEAK